MRFVKESVIRASPERVFAFHERPDALKVLIPPWESARVIETAQISQVGARAIVETRVLGPITIRWIAQHTAYNPPHSFEDIQIRGPFRSWRHRHLIERRGEAALLRDEIIYEPPLGSVGRLFAPWLVDQRLQRLFDYRHEVTRAWCEGKAEGWKDEGGRMKDEG